MGDEDGVPRRFGADSPKGGVDRSIGDSVGLPPTPVQCSEGPPRPNESEVTNPRTYGGTDESQTADLFARPGTESLPALPSSAVGGALALTAGAGTAALLDGLVDEAAGQVHADGQADAQADSQVEAPDGLHRPPWGANEFSSAKTDPPPPKSDVELRQALSFICSRLSDTRFVGVPSAAAKEELSKLHPDLCTLEAFLSQERGSGPEKPGSPQATAATAGLASLMPSEISRFVHSWLSSGDAFLSTCAMLLPKTPLATFLTRADYDRLSETAQDVRVTPEMLETALCKALRENWTEELAATLVGSFYNDFYTGLGARVGLPIPVSRLSRSGRIVERCMVLTGSLETHTEQDMVDAALLYAGYELERQVLEGREISSSSICEKAGAPAGPGRDEEIISGQRPFVSASQVSDPLLPAPPQA